MKYLKYVLIFIAVFCVGVIASYFVFQYLDNRPSEIVTSITPAPTATPESAVSDFSLENAPSKSLRGEITSMKGELKWQSRLATESAELLEPITVQQGEKVVTGEKSSMSIDFGACNLDLFSGTELEIIQTLPENILFHQISGDVDYVKTGDYPISVRVDYLLIEANGDFSVSVNPDWPIVYVTMKSGSAVAAYNDLNFLSHEINITKGKTFTFNYDTRRGALR